MVPSSRIRRGPASHRRRGQTLIELIVSMALATILMLGLGSSLLIASRAFDGTSVAVQSSQAVGVQADMMVDLNQAQSFVARNPDSVTFTVPDRNADGFDETFTYAWTGYPTSELTFAANGAPPVTVLRDVQTFQLSYLDRLLPGRSTTLPPLDPSKWGYRWQTTFNFGNETIFPSQLKIQQEQIGTLVTLTEPGTLKSISAYFEMVNPSKKTPAIVAIYNVDGSGMPNNLLASSAMSSISQTGWLTFATPDTVLNPGDYYLALCIENIDIAVPRYESGVGRTYTRIRDATRHGFSDPWGPINGSYTMRVSIYGSYKR